MPLSIGPYEVAAPVVLAPMAGITNQAFRRLCREYGAGFYVSEMVTSRALLERNDESLRLIAHDPDEHPRSVQLYGVDPGTVGAAVALLVEEDRADHVDLNFGCPVPKVTRKGGGSALPVEAGPLRRDRRAGRPAAQGRPVTVKMRKGIDPDHLTYLEAGRIAEAEGAAAVALHARTALDFYSGTADWSAIARLKEAVTTVPVLGNGDIWSADDALRMVAETGCDGVVVGRGCLGRPWLFADLAAAFSTTRAAATSGSARRSAASSPPCAGILRCSSSITRAPTPRTPSSAPAATSASTWPGTSRATWSARRPVPHSGWSSRWRGSTRSSSSSTPTSRIPGPRPRARAGGPMPPAAWPCPRGGSTAASSTRDWPRT